MKTNRDSRYDLVRTLAMVFVIGVHLPMEFTENATIGIIKNAVFLSCNGLFYILSGKFNISKRFVTSKDYVDYYKKKLIDIVFPFIAWSGFLYIYDAKSLILHSEGYNIWSSFLQTIFVENTKNHIWFMYPLIGLLVSAPFIAKLVGNLSEKETEILFVIGLIWEFVTVIIFGNMTKINNPFSGWFLSGWLFYFVLGGIYERIINTDSKRKKYIIVGFLMLLITILQAVFLPEHSQGIYDLSPIYTLAVLGIFLVVKGRKEISNIFIKNGITFIAKHSYGIYFVHQLVINWTVYHFRMFTGVGGYILKYFVVIIVSLVCVCIADFLVISPVKKLLYKHIL